ncbi:hypothetical protein ES707_01094 [subsurface metagenome]|uniref:Uncharacterized protein n=1 Tax=marine sediment metagenome TaxID=412755 RepID=X1UPH9_9ZZZZ
MTKLEDREEDVKLEDRITQILGFNENLAFSILELVDRIEGKFYFIRYMKILWAVTKLQRKGLIVGKRIGLRIYYACNKGE